MIKYEFECGLTDSYKTKIEDTYKEQKLTLKGSNRSMTPIDPPGDPMLVYNFIVGRDFNPLPQEYPEFDHLLNTWAGYQKSCGVVVAEMLAIGLGLEKTQLSRAIEKGDAVSGPPGINLAKTNPGDVLTAFHVDFGLFTIHGRNRFPGLFAWTRTG